MTGDELDASSRRRITRRRLLAGAAAGGAAASVGLGSGTARATAPATAPGSPPLRRAIVADPKPTRAGITSPGGSNVGWHLGGLGRDAANSSIFDFDGTVAGAGIRGPGWLFPSGVVDEGDPIAIEFDADVRFMQGRYVDRGGNEQYGTFAFI
jgi:hypothetical protein